MFLIRADSRSPVTKTVFRYARPFLLALWVVLICCVIVGSLLPASSPVILAIGRLHISFKVLHFCAYTSLALLALVAIRRRSAALLAALAMVLLGVALEFGQKLVPGRSCEVRDMFINGTGVAAGIAIGIPGRRITAADKISPPAAPGTSET